MTIGKLPEDFDPKFYLELHPDVKDSGLDAALHYLNHGQREGRPYQKAQGYLLPDIQTPYNFDGLRSVHNHDFMQEKEFIWAYTRGVQAAGQDYQIFWRVHLALWAARTSIKLGGDFVECGVNRGFVSSAIMKDLDWDTTGRVFYLLDTFAGLDERYVSANEKIGGILEKNRQHLDSGFYTQDFESVRKTFSEWKNISLIIGSIPETLSQITSEKIAFLHLDLNCSLPEIASIQKLWGRIGTGGIVLLDDYGYYGFHSQKKAFDCWAAETGIPIASLPTGQGLIIKT